MRPKIYLLLLEIILLIHGKTSQCGMNLVKNGHGEMLINGKCDTTKCPNMWKCKGIIKTMSYNSLISPIIRPKDSDDCVFSGSNKGNILMYQSIDLKDYTDLIDSEYAEFILSAWLGGEHYEQDEAKVSITFQNCNLENVGYKITIGPVSSQDRYRITGTVFRNKTGIVPANSRFVIITVEMTHNDNNNDALVDNIHFEIKCNNQKNKLERGKITTVLLHNPLILDPCIVWNHHATTFLNSNIDISKVVGISPFNSNATYEIFLKFNKVLVHNEENITSAKNISLKLIYPKLFVIRRNGTIYHDDSSFDHIIQNITTNPRFCIDILPLINKCTSMFIDVKNKFYCSLRDKHQVVILHIYGSGQKFEVGTGINGSLSHLLNQPTGIFVDENLNLYVADSGNNRIQLFQSDHKNGTTMVGNRPTTINGLNFPTGIIVDKNKNLFIVDSGNNRIVISTINGIRCMVGCSEVNQLRNPQTLWFDDIGNMFILDSMNKRIQKFSPKTNLYGKQDKKYEISAFCLFEFTCLDPTRFGINCSYPKTKCNLSKPCKNGGTCNDLNLNLNYNCSCPPDFDGKHCENDRQVCKENSCWNNGICNRISETNFKCICASGWEGKHCEKKINLCISSPCQNRGVCFPSLLNYTCECLQGSYSGRHCEIIATRIQILQIVSTSVSYIAIIAMGTVVMFVLIMDILKYCFGIDPVEGERERLRREKNAKKRKRPVIQKFIYVNAPQATESTNQNV